MGTVSARFSRWFLPAAKSLIAISAALSALPAGADTDTLTDFSENNFSFMQTLSDLDWHDMREERWNAYGQATYISSWKPAFPAAYTNLNGTPNSLIPNAERSFTVTGYFGLKSW